MNAPMSEQRLAEILARANAATSGPWCTDSWEIYQDTEYQPGFSEWIGETARGAVGLMDEDRANAAFMAAARSDVPDLVAEVLRLEAERHSTNEALSEAVEALDVARDRIAELETHAYGCDAEGCVIPHSSWCDLAQKAAAENSGCTCGKPLAHAMHCWTVNPPRSEVEEMRRALADRPSVRPREDPHDSPLHHDYALGRDLPTTHTTDAGSAL